MRTWLRCVPDLVILEETRRGGRQCATDLAGPTKVTLATPAEIKVDLIVSHFVRRHLPFSETIEGGKKENNVAHDARCIEHFTRARETMGGGIGRNALAGGSPGGCQIWPGWNPPGNVAAIGADLA